jgi:hypothetical protein
MKCPLPFWFSDQNIPLVYNLSLVLHAHVQEGMCEEEAMSVLMNVL